MAIIREISYCRAYLIVSGQVLYRIDVNAVFQKMRRKTVT